MMTQEEYMNVKALHAGGWTIKQIAEHLGFHPPDRVVVAEERRAAAQAVGPARRAGHRRALAGPHRRAAGPQLPSSRAARSCG